jgi:cbb3-type cytochrome c oxidase subunit III
MNKNKHLLLWSSLGVLALLVAAAVQENYCKEWQQIQRATAGDGGPIEIHLRQTVVPQLKVADRCVSCHVGMAAGEQGLSGGPMAQPHPPVGHDPAAFGCTVCHGGQGLATEKADAHGDVPFWPEPMIPRQFAAAGCGTCHVYVNVPDRVEMARAQTIVERYDCLACHRIDGRGGTIRPGGAGGMEGPDLSRVGAAGYDRDWYEKHIEHRDAAADGPWQSAFGRIDERDRETIAAFLATRTGVPQLIAAKATFHSLGCRGCHKIEGVGGEEGPDLTRVGQKDPGQIAFAHVPGEETLANWLSAHTRDPARVVPGSKMPAFTLSDSEVEQLTFYMLAHRRSPVPDAYWPKDRIQVQRFKHREFATDGATLFSTFCAGCHGQGGEGRRFADSIPFSAVGNADFQAVATDQFLQATITGGRPGRRMPAWGESGGGLRPEEIQKIVGHLRQLGGVKEPRKPDQRRRWVAGDAAAGKRLFATNCAGCHGSQGEGLDAPALNNQALLTSADDTYLLETIGRGRRGTPMRSFREGSPVNPALSAAEIESLVAYLRTWEGK